MIRDETMYNAIEKIIAGIFQMYKIMRHIL